MQTKVTKWYSAHIKPVRSGVYQRSLPTGSYYSLFKDGVWYAYDFNITKASTASVRSIYQNAPWRGRKCETI